LFLKSLLFLTELLLTIPFGPFTIPLEYSISLEELVSEFLGI